MLWFHIHIAILNDKECFNIHKGILHLLFAKSVIAIHAVVTIYNDNIRGNIFFINLASIENFEYVKGIVIALTHILHMLFQKLMQFNFQSKFRKQICQPMATVFLSKFQIFIM